MVPIKLNNPSISSAIRFITRKMGLYNVISLLLLMLLQITNAASNAEEYQTYIIHMDHSHKPAYFLTHEAWHRSTLKSLSSTSPADRDDSEMLLYSYSHVMHGFSARLTPSQLSKLESSSAHVATYPESFGKMFTTHSPKFLGLRQNLGLWPAASYGQDVIIGIIDSGIWPESESFGDKGMSEVPERWKGACENGTAFTPSLCNKKLIGARSFSKGLEAAGISISKEYDYDSPRDFLGHGTHTSSTAAGNHVLSASHFGYAKGTARGVAPRAHVAMYKVLWASDSEKSAATDVLAGMDQAISDGVDIMSLSIGFDFLPYYNDIIAIGALSAIEKGIVVVCAAGNDGWAENSTYNGAPWITTVGAGTLDRSFTATLTLDNGLTVEGESYFPESVYISDKPLYYGKDNASKAICYYGALDPKEVAGKVVLCDNTMKTDVDGQKEEVRSAGAYAGIFMTDMSLLDPQDFVIPALIVPISTGALIREYATQANTTKVKTLTFVHTNLGIKPAPQVAFFSSRGPDPITPGILKPDILAPGVDVLAAVAPNRLFIEVNNYNLASDYQLMSGTSMAAPHVAGVAALLKAVHREWSPAAIRSAIMTTAYSLDNTKTTIKDQWGGLPATPLEFGAGHINPNRAMNPGLIYDMDVQDYIEFLCGLGYTAEQMSAVIRRNQWSCHQQPAELNYPSFIAIFNGTDGSPKAKNFSRVVTNVGDGTSIYKAFLEVPSGMKIAVEPSSLTFTGKNQEQGFVLRVEIDNDAPKVTYGYLKWIDQQNHIVSSPVVVINY
ncbi:subtilisin-like protease SBT1.8 [Prunus avium]|uniref:Subtilisin-like protease SBT1.8 n=1 Tax=Prunus avium TaxID=42229 RepID=A0A6P5STM0_PRUAV|nr:subtilisin-like protease SBT1.8 [Prunus avium]